MSDNNNGAGGGRDDVERFNITARDLLQVNATIIAGVLIFLSLALSFPSQFGRPLPTYAVIAVFIAIIPFVLSCDFLLMRWNDDRMHSEKRGAQQILA